MAKRDRPAAASYKVPRYLMEQRLKRRETSRSLMLYVVVAVILVGIWFVLTSAEPRVTGIDSRDRQAPSIHWGGGPRSD